MPKYSESHKQRKKESDENDKRNADRHPSASLKPANEIPFPACTERTNTGEKIEKLPYWRGVGQRHTTEGEGRRERT